MTDQIKQSVVTINCIYVNAIPKWIKVVAIMKDLSHIYSSG